MKKILVLIICVLLLSGCSRRKTNEILSYVEVAGTNCVLDNEKDSHGGFLGDGDYYARIKCDSVELLNSWKELPLPEEIEEIMSMEQCTEKDCKTPYDRYNIPKLENGKFIFIDRHSESTNKYEYKEINDRASYNFTLGLLDIENNTVYVYELDT